MKVIKNKKDTTMHPACEKDAAACDFLMQGSDTAVVKMMVDDIGMYLEFTPVQTEDIVE